MSSTPIDAARSRSISLLAPLAVLTAVLFWAYWPTFLDLAQTWKSNAQYSHGFLVPVFAGFLLYSRRNKLRLDELRPSTWGFALLGLGLGMRLLGAYRYYVSLDAISIIPSVAGVALLVGGKAAWRWAWPAILFLSFMIPLPYFVATSMAGPLQRLATITSTFVMQVLGLPALSEGNVILLNDHTIGVVEACSGLRMLVVFFALSTAMIMVIDRHWIDRTVILFSAVPIAVVSNILRVTVTGIMYDLGASEMAEHFFHDVAGYLMMPLALGMLWVEMKVLDKLIITGPAPVPASRRAPAAATNRRAPTAPKAQLPRRAAARPTRTEATPAPAERADVEAPANATTGERGA